LGSKQVRASGTVGGNIANGSPIGDTPPILIALDCELELTKGKTIRRMPLESFFIEYGRQDRRAGELVSAIRIPALKRGQHFRAYKISKRFDQDISAVLGAFRITISRGKITDTRIAFGGMAATPKRAKRAEAELTGIAADDAAGIASAIGRLTEDFQPISDMRASSQYRMKVASNLLRKALIEISSGSSAMSRVTGYRELAGAPR
jgi:xanthine dehydrogenase small subunit